MEGDVGTGAGFKGGKSHIGGFGNGHRIPDAPYTSRTQSLIVTIVFRKEIMQYTTAFSTFNTITVSTFVCDS